MFGGDQESCAIRGAPNEALERERGLKREKGLKRIWRACGSQTVFLGTQFPPWRHPWHHLESRHVDQGDG